MRSRWIWLHGIIVTSSLSALLAGCMVGPNFHSPATPTASRFNEKPLPAKTASTPAAGQAGKSQEFAYNEDITSDWWHLFRSPALNSLITKGLNNSPNLAAAYAALRQAQENFNAQVGNLMLPAIDALLYGERQRFSATTFGADTTSSNVFNLFNANVSVSYTLDVFGGSRRQLEALNAQVDFQQFELIAAYLTLTANIVTTAVAVASLEAQIEATHALINDEQESLRIIRNQYRLGGVANTTVLQQEALLAQTMATLPALEKSASQNRHILSVLIGEYPNSPLPQIKLSSLYLPKRLPVSLPSNIVHQRPDIRASEALLHAATAQIGVATANLFPQIPLTGTYGWQSLNTHTLFMDDSKVWTMIGGLTQPIFHGGALFAQRRAAKDAFDQALAQYRQTVLQAFQNVADSLRAIETDARTFQAQKAAEVAARTSLQLIRQQYQLGGVNYLNLLTAQQQYQQAVITRIQAQAARYADTAALFQALGGGWWNNKWCVKECLYEKQA